jgi:serine/threonine protein kinase
MLPRVSTTFGPFVLERLLGRGGMAEAFVAKRRGDEQDRWLVLKRIRPDVASQDEFLRRLVLEAQVVSRALHPGLVRFREFGRVGEHHYLAMDMVRGWNLRRIQQRLEERSAWAPVGAALSLGAGILDGLAALHALVDEDGRPRPMLHRDVTPANVIVGREGRPVLIDLGIAKDIHGPAITLPGRVIGTARYMAPEHRRAEFIDARADVFSASVILFELLAGRPPWPPLSSMKELLRFTFDPPAIDEELARRVPRDVLAVVLRGLDCEPQRRWGDATEMSRALRASSGFPARDEAAEVVTWASSLGLPLDEDLAEPVLDDAGPGEPLGYTPGEAEVRWSADALDEPDPDAPASADVLRLPPLPPRRDASLIGEVELVPPRRPAAGVVVVALALAAVGLGLLAWAR